MNIVTECQNLVEVKQFKYLVSILAGNGDCNKEVRRRIFIGKTGINREKRLLTGKLNMNLKKNMAKSLIWSAVLYYAKKWILKTVDRRLLESLEMWK